MLTISKASAPRKSKALVIKANPVVVLTKANKKKKKSKGVRSIPRGLSTLPSEAYFRCLCDPFNYPPPRLGYGTMVPTQIHTAYVRTQIISNATDGTFVLFALPNQNNLLLANTAGSGTNPASSTASLTQSANVAFLNSAVDMTRTIAMGLRIYPMTAATDSPGLISLGCSPRGDLADLVAGLSNASPGVGIFNRPYTTVNQLPYLREHIAHPANLDHFEVTWRPTDLRDLEFTPGDSGVIGYSSSGAVSPFFDILANSVTTPTVSRQNDTQGSFLVVTGTGLKPGAVVYVEVILHLECTASSKFLAGTDFASTNPNQDDVASTSGYSSFESLYRSLLSRLPSVDQAISAATSVASSPMVQSAARRYMNIGVRESGFQLL